jgi:hypothetical protein
MTSNEIAFDDFTAIRGIGSTRQKWLRDTFDILTYQELAELTESEIEGKLKAEGKIASREAIKSWLVQARDLIPETVAARQTIEGPVADELTEKLNSTGHKNGWAPFASFLVYFQTRDKDQDQSAYQTLVHYMEEDREANWPGIEVNRLTAWMLEQIGDTVDISDIEINKEEEHPQDDASAIESMADIKIDQVRIFQPTSADEPAYQINAGQSFEGELTSNQPFRFVVDFGLSGGIAGDIAEQGITCLARCYEYENQTSSSALLSESLPTNLKAGKLDYTFEIPEASLPPGDYSMWVVVTTKRTDRLIPDFLELPKLTVA